MYGLQKEGTDETVFKAAMENTEIEKTLMDKEVVVHIHTVEHDSAIKKNESESLQGGG